MASLKTIDRGGLAAFAQELVRTPSLSSQEGDVAALLAQEMREGGFDEVTIDRMGNVVGRIGPHKGKKLLYDGHMDTVDVGSLETWKRDPYGGIIEGGVLYGRGASDMKGALAAMVYAGKAIVESGVRLGGDLYVVGIVHEEPCEGAALQHLVELEGLRPDAIILGEATNLQLARGQRGRIELRIDIRGRSCHSAVPDKGVNAIYAATRVIVGLELLAQQLNQDSFLGKGSIAVTEISSQAGSRNTVPDSCTLTIDRRLTTGETEAKALAEVRRVLSREGAEGGILVPDYVGRSYTGYEIKARQYFPYWVTSEDEPILMMAEAVVENVLGFVPRVGKWDFSTDGAYSAGIAGIPTLGFGPGEERYAHTADEQIRLKDLEAAARVYAELAVRWLGKA
jgi:putative selenium metabolism hydrolase